MAELQRAITCLLLALLCVYVTLLLAAEFEDDPTSRPAFIPAAGDVW